MFGMPGGIEWIVIGVVMLLLFGRRLPDVARSIGKSIVEFKRGLKDVKNDIETSSRIETKDPPKIEQQSESPPSEKTDG